MRSGESTHFSFTRVTRWRRWRWRFIWSSPASIASSPVGAFAWLWGYSCSMPHLPPKADRASPLSFSVSFLLYALILRLPSSSRVLPDHASPRRPRAVLIRNSSASNTFLHKQAVTPPPELTRHHGEGQPPGAVLGLQDPRGHPHLAVPACENQQRRPPACDG